MVHFSTSYYISHLGGKGTEIIDTGGFRPDRDALKAIIDFCINSLENYDETEDHNNYHWHCHKNKLNPATGLPYGDEPLKPQQLGHIYIAKDSAAHRYLKIGFSLSPELRERTLQADKPTIKIIASFPGTLKNERAIHAILKDKRFRGEWFDASMQEVLDAINLVIPDAHI